MAAVQLRAERSTTAPVNPDKRDYQQKTTPLPVIAFSEIAMGTSHPTRQPRADADSLERDGYAIVKQLLSGDEVDSLRATALETIAELECDHLTDTDSGPEGRVRVSRCDLLSLRSLRHVLFDHRLIEAIERLLGGKPAYFGDSSLRVGKNGTRAWHRDNVDRVRASDAPDWQNPYPLLRCGLYLQDQAGHSGGLALRPHSNRPDRRVPTVGRLIPAGAGDLVAWDLRTVHSGEAVRVRGLPGVALNPRLQTLMPPILRAPEHRERIVLFMTFGLPGEHLDNYIAYCRTRDYMRTTWASSRFGPEVWEEAENAGLNLMRPSPEYGTPAPPPLGS